MSHSRIWQNRNQNPSCLNSNQMWRSKRNLRVLKETLKITSMKSCPLLATPSTSIRLSFNELYVPKKSLHCISDIKRQFINQTQSQNKAIQGFSAIHHFTIPKTLTILSCHTFMMKKMIPVRYKTKESFPKSSVHIICCIE